MTRGDMVRLLSVSDDNIDRVVVLSTPGQQRHIFDQGTLAVYLGVWQRATKHGEAKIQVLVENVVGWVYNSECEVISGKG